MKKILIILGAVLMMTACKKERSEVATVTLRFTPYEVSPMKTASVSTVCSRLDVYIVEVGTTDTLRIHQDRAINGTAFGGVTATLQTNRSYHLYVMGHNTTDTCTFSGGVFSFADDVIKQCLYADTVFSPGDGLSLTVVMQRIVGMFKMRVTDEIPDNVTGFRFTIDTSGRKWDAGSMQSADRGVRVHSINSTSTDDNGVAVYNVYVMGDNMTDVLYVDIVAEAVDAGGQAVETREFAQVPIRDGYLTTYTGTFFITFDMGFTFLVDDWGNYGSYTF